ncbi:MAG: hypothetical protein ACQEQP_05115 [Bacillota bacterium]
MSEDKLQLYYKLYDLSRRQREEILTGTIDKVLEIIRQKSELVLELEEIDLESEIRAHKDPRGTLIEMQNLLKRLTELEQENTELLKDMAPDLEQKVNKINQEYNNASDAYKDKSRNKRGGSNIDERS